MVKHVYVIVCEQRYNCDGVIIGILAAHHMHVCMHARPCMQLLRTNSFMVQSINYRPLCSLWSDYELLTISKHMPLQIIRNSQNCCE